MVVREGKVEASLPLEVAGIMSRESASEVAAGDSFSEINGPGVSGRRPV